MSDTDKNAVKERGVFAAVASTEPAKYKEICEQLNTEAIISKVSPSVRAFYSKAQNTK